MTNVIRYLQKLEFIAELFRLVPLVICAKQLCQPSRGLILISYKSTRHMSVIYIRVESLEDMYNAICRKKVRCEVSFYIYAKWSIFYPEVP
jgi:hypothetical protein